MKKLLILFLCCISFLFLTGCGQLSEEEYNKRVKEFDDIFDEISPDFYQQALLVSEGKKITTNLYDLYHEDIERMDTFIEDLNSNNVPSDKVDDLLNRKDIYISILLIESDTIIKKVSYASDWVKFKNYAEKRFAELGILDQQKTIAVEASKPPLELLDKTDIYEDGISYITGTIINNSQRTYNGVSIKINIYDKDDILLGNASDYITDLPSGEKWKFKAVVFEDGFQKYRVVDISGY